MANEIYNTSWWGTALDTARTAGTNPDFFGSQFKLLTSEQDNIVVNGDFSNGTNNWTPNAGATLSIDNGKLKVLINGTSGYPGQFVDTIIGKTYKVTADGFIGTSSRIALYNDADGQFRSLYADGNFNFNFIATSTSTQLRLYVFDNGAYGLWDNVSIQLVRCDLDQIEAKKCLADWIHTTALKDLNN